VTDMRRTEDKGFICASLSLTHQTQCPREIALTGRARRGKRQGQATLSDSQGRTQGSSPSSCPILAQQSEPVVEPCR
jgi:hypothetical protein